jgi:hypothetical protein
MASGPVMVVGGTGFLGAHVAHMLAKHSPVVSFDINPPAPPNSVGAANAVHHVTGDILDGAAVVDDVGGDRHERGSQDSNLEPPVLETGTLPIELLPLRGHRTAAVGRKDSTRGLRICPDAMGTYVRYASTTACRLRVGYGDDQEGP